MKLVCGYAFAPPFLQRIADRGGFIHPMERFRPFPAGFRRRGASRRGSLTRLLVVTMVLAAGGLGLHADRFDDWDADGDGFLSVGELPEPARAIFKRVDRDGDGRISREEDETFAGGRAGVGTRAKAGRGDLEGVRIERDVSYAGTDNARQTLDLYLPVEPVADDLPLVVFIHGGAWMQGSKAAGARNVGPLVATGRFAGASVGYRLSGEARWPAQIHDCKAAVRWLRSHASRYGIDPGRIVVWGASAGGHLASMLGTTGGIAGFDGELGDHRDVDSRIQGVVNFFGPSDLLTMGDHPSSIDHDAPDSPESRLIGGPVQERREQARAASPLTHVSGDDPPFIHVHGTRDPLVPFQQGRILDEALDKAGVASVLVTVEGGGHGGFRNAEINRRVRAFLDAVVGDEEPAALPAGLEGPLPASE